MAHGRYSMGMKSVRCWDGGCSFVIKRTSPITMVRRKEYDWQSIFVIKICGTIKQNESEFEHIIFLVFYLI